jgi:hypothetical protein
VKSKCVEDGRWYDSDDTLERMNTWLENPLIIKQVIQPLAREHNTTAPHTYVCPTCFTKAVERVLNDNSRGRDILTEDELRYVEG